MSPTVFREGRLRFYFFSREEPRLHVHVASVDGEAKFWIQPAVELAANYGLNSKDLRDAHRIIVARLQEILDAWNRHFGSAS